eukprot:1147941-Pelagomonas_calceolata.AAC.8
MLYTVTKLTPVVINSLSLYSQGSEVWNCRVTSGQKLAKAKTANHAINALYYYDFDVTHIDGWRNCTVNKKYGRRSLIYQQVHYHTHSAPMIIEE